MLAGYTWRWSIALLVCVLIVGCASSSSAPAAPRRATSRTLDLAIDGDGYFIVQTAAGGFLFTRSGELAVSSSGELVNVDGYRLYPPVAIPENSKNITITPDGAVRSEVDGAAGKLIGQIVLSRFSNTDHPEKDGVYFLLTDVSAKPITGRPNTNGLGSIKVGELED